MFKKLFSATLICGAVLPAQATPTVKALADAIKATGTTIVADLPEVCNDKSIMGMYEYKRNVIDRMTICIENHEGDSAALRDTFLHEAVHLAQACKGKPIFTAASIFNASTKEEIYKVSNVYPSEEHHLELEAHVIAREQDEVFVTNLIKETCK